MTMSPLPDPDAFRRVGRARGAARGGRVVVALRMLSQRSQLSHAKYCKIAVEPIPAI